MKLLPTIRPLTSADAPLFPEGVDLLNRTQGIGLFAKDYLEVTVNSPKALVPAAFIDSQLVGIGVAEVIDAFEFYLPFDAQISSKLSGKKVGSFSTLAISEDFQGRGIGQLISQARLAWLRKEGCEEVVGVSWVSGLGHTSDRVFEKMGFRAVKKVEMFFREASLKRPFDCPGCRRAPCECAAIFYRLRLES